jgi:hypothetical protein
MGDLGGGSDSNLDFSDILLEIYQDTCVALAAYFLTILIIPSCTINKILGDDDVKSKRRTVAGWGYYS